MRTPSSFLRLLAPVALLLMLAAALEAAAPTTRLVIQVKSPGGKPVDRAAVTVIYNEGRSLARLGRNPRTSFDLRTNQDGEAKIPPIPQGKVRILVNAKGYQTFGDTFEVTEKEKTIEIKLNPPQPQYSAH